MSERRKEALFMAGLLAGLAAVQSVGVHRPFLRHHESVCTEFAKHARNHLKFGLGATAGLRLDVSGHDLAAYGDYRAFVYPDHPPLPALLLAGVFAVAGPEEVAIRGMLILLSAAAVLLFRSLARRLLAAPADRAATLLFAALPAFAYYSIVTVLQVTALVGVLAALIFYLRWADSGRRRDFAGLLAAIAWACLSAWMGYYVALVILAVHLTSRRPGAWRVSGLIGFNVLLFGLYLIWLWAFDPAGLTAVRQLSEVALDRSTLHAPPLLSYLAGEARELLIMMTFPALALAGIWAAGVLRGSPTAGDRVIAALPLLGLDEVAFARVCARHDYFTYPLAVFVALAAAAGLVRSAQALQSRAPRLSRAVWAAGLSAVLLQSSAVLHRRLTTEGGYAFYHRLGLALEKATAPDEQTLVLTDNIPFYTPFYGDRAVLWYDRRSGRLLRENTGPRPRADEADVAALIRTPGALEWAVAAEASTVLPEVPFLQGLPDATLESFGVSPGRSPWRDHLEPLYGPPQVVGGFLFWRLRRP